MIQEDFNGRICFADAGGLIPNLYKFLTLSDLCLALVRQKTFLTYIIFCARRRPSMGLIFPFVGGELILHIIDYEFSGRQTSDLKTVEGT